jgi:uncharacterized coiled-coil protein SlyX
MGPDAGDHGNRLTILETKQDAFEKTIEDISESITWLTRSIFGLMASVVLAIAVLVAQGGTVGV